MGLRSVWETLGHHSGISVTFEKLFKHAEFEISIYICSAVNKLVKNYLNDGSIHVCLSQLSPTNWYLTLPPFAQSVCRFIFVFP